ncbi:MAG: panB [Chloroflexi bacterium]|nr:panB [Chloroflexota bacterium]
MQPHPKRRYHLHVRTTIQQVQAFKDRQERFAVLTAYDYSMAKLVDECEVPIILVGDSLGVVMLGYENTLSVTMDDMVRHTQAVERGASRALIVADMPFMSFQVSPEEALRNAGRLLREGGAQAVKLEGGVTMAETVRRMVEVGIPVMGHIGLTPQSVYQLSGYKPQGKTIEVAERLLRDAAALEEAGAFSMVLEGVPAPLSALITDRVGIPTIGIGAGSHCDGQVQVIHDMLGLFSDFVPRHVRRYAQLGDALKEAVRKYTADIASGAFPSEKESFTLDEAVLRQLEGKPHKAASGQ